MEGEEVKTNMKKIYLHDSDKRMIIMEAGQIKEIVIEITKIVGNHQITAKVRMVAIPRLENPLPMLVVAIDQTIIKIVEIIENPHHQWYQVKLEVLVLEQVRV